MDAGNAESAASMAGTASAVNVASAVIAVIRGHQVLLEPLEYRGQQVQLAR